MKWWVSKTQSWSQYFHALSLQFPHYSAIRTHPIFKALQHVRKWNETKQKRNEMKRCWNQRLVFNGLLRRNQYFLALSMPLPHYSAIRTSPVLQALGQLQKWTKNEMKQSETKPTETNRNVTWPIRLQWTVKVTSIIPWGFHAVSARFRNLYAPHFQSPPYKYENEKKRNQTETNQNVANIIDSSWMDRWGEINISTQFPYSFHTIPFLVPTSFAKPSSIFQNETKTKQNENEMMHFQNT